MFACSALPASTSISQFISQNPPLSMLEKCTNMRDLHKLHAQIIKTGLARDHIPISRVLAFCATSPYGNINYAMLVFSQIDQPNPFIWNTIIRGFSQSSNPQKAIYLFFLMLHSSVQPQTLTYPSLFKACSQLGSIQQGIQIHCRIIKLGVQSDQFVQNSLIHMYSICGNLDSARQLFDKSSSLDVVSWNSMILGLARSGFVEDSRHLFDKMPQKTSISWNSMIGGYVLNGKFKEALDLFRKMQKARIELSIFTMVSLLSACSRLGALDQGEWIHAYIDKNEMQTNLIVSTAIIDMYCKCGSMDKAIQVFETSPTKGLSSWNSIISGLAMHGHGREAIQIFKKLQLTNLRPDYVTFIGVLNACNHSGLVEEAQYYFSLMIEKYKIKPDIKHYGCLVDVMGRAGLLEEAEELITNMPLEPDVIIWGSLLAACRKHGNIKIGKRAARRIITLDPRDSCSYILLSNAYSWVGQFRQAMDARIMMKDRKIRKEPGCSLIEINGVVHEFFAGDRYHPKAKEIHSLLGNMVLDSNISHKDNQEPW